MKHQNRPVFSVPGLYRFYFADNLYTEKENTYFHEIEIFHVSASATEFSRANPVTNQGAYGSKARPILLAPDSALQIDFRAPVAFSHLTIIDTEGEEHSAAIDLFFDQQMAADEKSGLARTWIKNLPGFRKTGQYKIVVDGLTLARLYYDAALPALTLKNRAYTDAQQYTVGSAGKLVIALAALDLQLASMKITRPDGSSLHLIDDRLPTSLGYDLESMFHAETANVYGYRETVDGWVRESVFSIPGVYEFFFSEASRLTAEAEIGFQTWVDYRPGYLPDQNTVWTQRFNNGWSDAQLDPQK